MHMHTDTHVHIRAHTIYTPCKSDKEADSAQAEASVLSALRSHQTSWPVKHRSG